MIHCSPVTVGKPIMKAGAVRCLEFANMVGKEVTLL